MMLEIRRGEVRDLKAIAAIQDASPDAAHWKPAEYLGYDLWVAVRENRVAGFLVVRSMGFQPEGGEECEVLNLAVAPEARRQGIARRLFEARFYGFFGAVYLEVRESNRSAREFYKSMGFQEVSRRPDYYPSPNETAIVMKFHSC